MRRNSMLVLVACSIWVLSSPAGAAVRLIAITGESHTPSTYGSYIGFEVGPEDETLYELSLTNGAATRLFQPSRSPDTNAIGYNPNDGLIYHLTGAGAYRNIPGQFGYNDNQQMETIDPVTFAMTGVFNANGPPQTGDALVFGLAAPRPDWVLPAEVRTDEQTGGEFRQDGPNEYSSARGVAWSEADDLFYLTADEGLFSMTATGECLFIGPLDVTGKGIAFVDSKLYVGSREEDDGVIALLSEVDPTTGASLSFVEVKDTNGAGYQKVLALATNPETDELYGIVQKEGADTDTGRELVKINPVTGVATLVGTPLSNPSNFIAGDYNLNGAVDAADYAAWRNGNSNNSIPPSQNDYNTWSVNFGNTTPEVIHSAFVSLAFVPVPAAGSGAALGAVPEPSALVLAAMCVLGLLAGARGRHRRS